MLFLKSPESYVLVARGGTVVILFAHSVSYVDVGRVKIASSRTISRNNDELSSGS